MDVSVEEIRAEILRFSEELLKMADKTGLELRLFITDGVESLILINRKLMSGILRYYYRKWRKDQIN